LRLAQAVFEDNPTICVIGRNAMDRQAVALVRELDGNVRGG